MKAIVTGGASGSGAGICKALSDQGASIVVADLNEEGANLVALQTRQALATQALAFAGQAESGILQLFQ